MIRSLLRWGFSPCLLAIFLASLRRYRRINHLVNVSLPISAGSSSRTTARRLTNPTSMTLLGKRLIEIIKVMLSLESNYVIHEIL